MSEDVQNATEAEATIETVDETDGAGDTEGEELDGDVDE